MHKEKRYQRIYQQLLDLLTQTNDPVARMATIAALLHHKMNGFFWTGFYILKNGALIVGPYQGPVACQVLQKDRGVCWTGINTREPVLVPDVSRFPGHIACDPRSRSEIVIPVKDDKGNVPAVLDIDSDRLNQFDQTDSRYLEQITGLVYMDAGDQ